MEMQVKNRRHERCGNIRYLIAVLGSFGLGIIYGLKVNLHVAIITMVKSTGHGDEAPAPDGGEGRFKSDENNDDLFDWDTIVQGYLLSAYFWGYIVAQLPGGRVAEMFSAKWVMFFSVAINVVCTLLSPLMARIHYGALIAMRVGEGIGGGVTFPAMHVLLANWAPPLERSVMSTIVYAGTALGTVLFMLVTGFIADSMGWEAVFYLEGAFSALWCLVWTICTADSPDKHKFISAEERDYILSSTGESAGAHGSKQVPWKQVFTSIPFLAILIAHTCSNWGWYMVLIELPYYNKTVLKFNTTQNTILSTIPFFCMWIFSMILSNTLDYLQAKEKITMTFARKVATAFASLAPLICFVLLSYVIKDTTVAVVCMTIAITCVGGMFCGFLSNHIDIAPHYAGTLVAVTNTVATIPGIVVPLFVGEVTAVDKSINSWRIVFMVTVVLYAVEFVVYMVFGSAEVQPWNN